MDTTHFKKKLGEELALVEKELKSVGRINPENPSDWEATPADLNIPQSDANDRADAIEEFEARSATVKELEIRYNNIRRALAKIADDTFGTCEVDNKPIEEERLEANPAARTCIKHMDTDL